MYQEASGHPIVRLVALTNKNTERHTHQNYDTQFPMSHRTTMFSR